MRGLKQLKILVEYIVFLIIQKFILSQESSRVKYLYNKRNFKLLEIRANSVIY